MSQSHINQPKVPQPMVWWKVALGSALVLMLLGALWGIFNLVHSNLSNYETADGKILEMRKVVDGLVDSPYGGKILYGVEARVQYTVNGQMQERWLRASDNMPRETLLLKLADHPTQCIVYWPPKHPEGAKCWLK